MAKKRSGKFYFKNEKEVMKELGFKPTYASGSGWLEKEDGQSENAIAQLKSTDNQSINISLLDIQKLEHNGLISHKRPVFIIQFLGSNDIFLLVRPEQDMLDLVHDNFESNAIDIGEQIHKTNTEVCTQSTGNSRENFYEERDATYEHESEINRQVWRSLSKEKPDRELEPRLPI